MKSDSAIETSSRRLHSQELHPTSGYSRMEEWANSITHGIGLALSIAALVILVVFASLRAGPFLITASAIYGTTLIALHLFSTLYHSARNLRWKKVFLAGDHCAIYLLIAGTYTPFCLGPLRGPIGWSLFGIIWGLALLGILREILRPKRGTLFSTAIYLLMGWLVIGFIIPLVKALSPYSLVMLITGGVLFSIGVIFYRWHSLKFHHAIWHLCVVAAAACQFFAILGLLQR